MLIDNPLIRNLIGGFFMTEIRTGKKLICDRRKSALKMLENWIMELERKQDDDKSIKNNKNNDL
jgi:hypothetical protein